MRALLGAAPKSEGGVALSPEERADASLFAAQRLGFQPDAVQAEVLSSQIRRGILNCSRQWGKTTVTAVKAVHHAASLPGSTTLLVSATWDQVADFLERVKGMLGTLGMGFECKGGKRKTLRLANGSAIIAVSARSNMRGISGVSLMLIDEAAEVSDAAYRRLRPMRATIAHGGWLWLMSTPQGRKGFFYHEWENGGPRWTRIAVPATECPRIGAEFLEEERESMGDRWFRQEFLCEFLETRSSLFREEDIENCLFDALPPLWRSGAEY